MNIQKIIFCIYSLCFVACNGGSEDDPILLPSNLTTNIVVTNDGTGNVSIQVSAENANFFTIYFGESENETPLKNTDGVGAHKYSTSGDYSIKVRAHATDSKYIEKTEAISITVGSSPTVIIPTSGYTSPSTYAGLTLVWEDNFSGSSLNSAYWTAEIGTGASGWGNNELQYYRQENTSVKDGYLIITAKQESFSGSNYTSSRLITKGKKSFKYGRIDIRAALPKGQGIWPALWMLGDNINTVGWPKCGEIDIMEMVGGPNRDNTVYGTLHWDNAGSHACTCGTGAYTLSNGIFNDEFHVFSIVWNDNTITWFVDNVQSHQIDVSPTELNEFDASFFLIFNVAVGGNWPGSPDATTVFPQHMIVDYVRVFQ